MAWYATSRNDLLAPPSYMQSLELCTTSTLLGNLSVKRSALGPEMRLFSKKIVRLFLCQIWLSFLTFSRIFSCFGDTYTEVGVVSRV
jgi:hypothetical protein